MDLYKYACFYTDECAIQHETLLLLLFLYFFYLFKLNVLSTFGTSFSSFSVRLCSGSATLR